MEKITEREKEREDRAALVKTVLQKRTQSSEILLFYYYYFLFCQVNAFHKYKGRLVCRCVF